MPLLDDQKQRRIVALVADKAKQEGCLVAPVGSVFFLFQESGRTLTKDVDLVIHDADLEIADLHTLRRIAQTLGEHEVSHDGAVVGIRLKGQTREQAPEIELVRGRARARKGFISRNLLAEAARLAKREDNVLIYPEEFVLVLKADAAVDREERARKNPARRHENQGRAEVFRGDVFSHTRRMAMSGRIDRRYVESALSYLKQNRRKAVHRLLEEAGAFG